MASAVSVLPQLDNGTWSLWSLICVHNGHLLVETAAWLHLPISVNTQVHQWLIDHTFRKRLFAYSPLPQKINKVSIQKYRKTDNFKPPIYCILQHPLQFKMISAINLIFSARYRWKSRIICPQKERCYVKYYIFRKRKPISVKLFAKQVSCHL